jgi:hypothetical protein
MHEIDILLENHPEVIQAIEASKWKKMAIYSKEVDLYKDVFEEYNKFIYKVAKLIKSLDLHTPLEYSIAIKYLIDNGYLSKDMTFYRQEPKMELETNCGPNIIVGLGVCRNYTDFHYDTMVAIGEYVKRLFCTRSNTLKRAHEMGANHVFNLITHEDCLYGIDLVNAGTLYIFTNGFMLRELSNVDKAKVVYKPYFEMVNELRSLEEIVNNIKIFKEDSAKKHIFPIQYYEGILPDTFEYLVKQRDMFLDFHNETKDIKDNICEGMSRKREK